MGSTASEARPSTGQRTLWDVLPPLILRTRSGALTWRQRDDGLAVDVGGVTLFLSPSERGGAVVERMKLAILRGGEVIDEVEAAGSDPWMTLLRELRSTIRANQLAADKAIDEIMVALKAM